MKVKIYDKYFGDFYKVRRLVDYYTQNRLEKFENQTGWELDVWMDKNKGGDSLHPISCGLCLKRPRKSPLYVKNFAEDGDLAARKSFQALEKTVRREGNNWSR